MKRRRRLNPAAARKVLPPRRRVRRTAPAPSDRQAIAVRMYQAGDSIAAVAAHLGVSYTRVWLDLENAGVPRRRPRGATGRTWGRGGRRRQDWPEPFRPGTPVVVQAGKWRGRAGVIVRYDGIDVTGTRPYPVVLLDDGQQVRVTQVAAAGRTKGATA